MTPSSEKKQGYKGELADSGTYRANADSKSPDVASIEGIRGAGGQESRVPSRPLSLSRRREGGLRTYVGRKDVPVRHCSLHRPERGASLMPTRWL